MDSNCVSRRKFLSTVARVSTFTIVPAHVIAGSGKVPPSDKITVANIGCGTQGLREMGSMLEHERLRVVAVCDPNKYSTDYIDWSPNGLISGIRRVLQDDDFGKGVKGIPGGRDLAQQYVNAYYAKNKDQGHYSGCNSYEDFRELLAKESEVDVIKIMTPDHLHATIALAGMKAGKHVVTHKPIANRLYEARKTIEMAESTDRMTHLLAWTNRPEFVRVKRWIDDGVIGNLKEIHNWSFRPVWPQYYQVPKDRPPVPEGFNWDLWLGPVPHRPYHPHYTHNVFRGWYEFGGGSIADMGHYSLFPLFSAFDIKVAPHEVKGYGTTMRTVRNGVSRWVENHDAFPHSAMIKWSFPEQEHMGSFDLFWYDGGMKPFAPPELEEDGRDISSEGMMFVGTEGKILAGFRCENPEIIPKKKMAAYEGIKEGPTYKRQDNNDIWVEALMQGKESPGSFSKAKVVTETINLGAVALRAKKKLKYNSRYMEVDDREASAYIYRKYRMGWEV